MRCHVWQRIRLWSRLCATAVLQGPVQFDYDELLVIRLAAADMTADTEREVVIVQNTDVFPVEKEDVLNRREGKGEVPADADITGLSRLGDAVRIGDAQEIDGQFLVHAMEALLKHLEDCRCDALDECGEKLLRQRSR